MKYKNILIIRTDRIGDVLLSTPAIQAVRQAFQSSRIAFMTRPYTKDIVEGNPYLDEVIIYDKDGSHRSLLATIMFGLDLRKYEFDLAIILHSTVRINFIAFLAGIPKRVGFARKAAFLLTDKLPYVKPSGDKHESEYNLDVVRAAGIDFDARGFLPLLAVSKDAQISVDNFLINNGISAKDKLVGIHPGASCPSRIWPVKNFSKLADALAGNYGFKIIVLGVGMDFKLAEQLKANMNKDCLIIKYFTIQFTAALLKKCLFFISTDTGPAHIASAVGTPCITIFGRKKQGLGPVRWRPLGKDNMVLHKDIGCTECMAHNCRKGFACLQATTVDEVLDVAKKFI